MEILQGVAPKSSKLSSVKKLMVIGAVADVPENYPNVKVILDQLNIEALQFTVAADIKMCKFLLYLYWYGYGAVLQLLLPLCEPGVPM